MQCGHISPVFFLILNALILYRFIDREVIWIGGSFHLLAGMFNQKERKKVTVQRQIPQKEEREFSRQ